MSERFRSGSPVSYDLGRRVSNIGRIIWFPACLGAGHDRAEISTQGLRDRALAASENASTSAHAPRFSSSVGLTKAARLDERCFNLELVGRRDIGIKLRYNVVD